MTATMTLTRRSFLKVSTSALGGLLIGVALPAAGGVRAAHAAAATALGAWLSIDPDGSVTVRIPSAEMGQGIMSALSMLVAEELEVEWRQVRAETAPADPVYANPLFGAQATGGSTSVRAFFTPLRQAGAAAREMLRRAAAESWKAEVADCRAEAGFILHKDGRKAGYGALAAAAARQPVPGEIALKPRQDWHLLGTPAPRLDVPAKVDASAVFGIDVKLADMLIGSVAACPVFGGKLRKVEEAPALAVPGVAQVVPLEHAVVVLAEDYWAAKKGLEALSIEWEEGENASLDSARIDRLLEAGLSEKGAVAESVGNAAEALAGAAQTLEAVYRLPFLAHATMEPMNATARVTAEGVEIWAPTQAPGPIQMAVSQVLGLQPEQIRVTTTFLGGGFGRKFELDFVFQAVFAAKAAGRPVKLVWSREEDIRHDFYRPASLARIRAGLDREGGLQGWQMKIVAPSIMQRMFPQFVKDGVDPSSVEGAVDSPYAAADREILYVLKDVGVPVGFWRSVGNSITAFYVEGFLDELAHAAGSDPLAFRRKLLAGKPRHLKVLETAAEMAGWGKAEEGRSHGIALHESFGSIVAEVVEISAAREGLKVEKVTCAIDCGLTINPDTVTAQMHSGIIYGLTAALYGEITVKEGRAEQGNFDSYPLLGLKQTPQILVQIIESGEALGGVGEPATPPVAPALANAVFAATGKRLRSLPLAKGGVTFL